MTSTLRRQALSGRSAPLLALIVALSLFLAYAPTAQAQASTDATLSALTLQADGQPLTLTPSFASGAAAYTASVAGSVPWLTVTPTVSDSGATITVNTPALSSSTPVDSGAASPLLLLDTGDNAIEIEATAADGSTTKTYTVTITRPDGGCGSSAGIVPAQTRLLADCATLLGLKDELRGAADLNWATNVAIADWDGVILSSDSSRLNRLALSVNDLTGSIPPELGSLTNLENLVLNANRLTGNIPPELGSLTNLEYLLLHENELTGSIPPELGSLTNLEYLLLHENELTGSIPPELGSLTNLQDLYLHENELTGVIPLELGSLTNLQDLYLHANRLTGEIPKELGNLTLLDSLWLHCNELTGGVPTALAALDGKLKYGLWLQGNPLDSVAIPTGLTADKVRLSGARGIWTEAEWCGPPAFADSSAMRTVVEGTPSGQTIGDPVPATDPDNRPLANTQPLTYALIGADASPLHHRQR